MEPLFHFPNKVLFAPIFYTKISSSDERLIQLVLSLYPMLLFTCTLFNAPGLASQRFLESGGIFELAR